MRLYKRTQLATWLTNSREYVYVLGLLFFVFDNWAYEGMWHILSVSKVKIYIDTHFFKILYTCHSEHMQSKKSSQG